MRHEILIVCCTIALVAAVAAFCLAQMRTGSLVRNERGVAVHSNLFQAFDRGGLLLATQNDASRLYYVENFRCCYLSHLVSPFTFG